MSGPVPGGVVCLSATGPGRALAARLPYRHRHGDVSGALAEEWPRASGLVVVLAVGATVRLVAPLLAAKATDPAVVCVDDAGRFAVALCGGHAAGANALAAEVAAHLGAEPVVTTATDRLGVPALDQLPGLRAEGALAAVTAALLGGEPIALSNERGWPVPESLVARTVPDGHGVGSPAGRIEVRDGGPVGPGDGSAPGAGPVPPVVVLRPPSLVVGVGSARAATGAELRAALAATLADAGLARRSIALVATIDRRAEHPAVLAVAAELGVAVTAYGAACLDGVAVPHPSRAVREAVGTGSVAEAAALRAAGDGASLVAGKHAAATVTVAIARRARPPGVVSVVGLGPGAAAHRTPAAERAVRRADVVVGFTAYVEQCRDLLSPAQQVVALPLGAEVERARFSLDEARAGRRVALVCSGDAGVYAMASPLLELDDSGAVEVEVVPGVTAGLAAGALLGAPLGHDHVVISLSDLHTPWAQIARRLEAAAAADLVAVLYNPRSARRTWQLAAARDILLGGRHPSTPVGLVTDAARPGQRVVHTTLAEMADEEVTMTTCVVVGSSATRRVGGRMVTPRGYDG